MKMTNRRNLFILVFALLVVMLGFGMVIPVFPFLIDKLGASGSALVILVAIAALTEFLFGLIWGSISDRVGLLPVYRGVGECIF
jgi:DHA1 family multidrug resistance protein-like MFS transporter